MTDSVTASANLIAANPAAAAFIGTTSADASTSKVAFGGVIGGGIEAVIATNWSVKAEYLYLALPQQTVVATLGTAGISRMATFSNDLHVFRTGLNYRF